jgi:hypothetical protein
VREALRVRQLLALSLPRRWALLALQLRLRLRGSVRKAVPPEKLEQRPLRRVGALEELALV